MDEAGCTITSLWSGCGDRLNTKRFISGNTGKLKTLETDWRGILTSTIGRDPTGLWEIKRLTRSTSHTKGASLPLSGLLKPCTIYPPIFCLDNGEGLIQWFSEIWKASQRQSSIRY